MKEIVRTKILSRHSTGGNYYILELGNPFQQAFKPGQFIMLSAAEAADPFLKRPYSVYRFKPVSAENSQGKLELLIKAVGKGSNQMRELPIGTEVEVVGPLGNGFTIRENLHHAIFVAGGIGVAPFVALAESELMKDIEMTALIGGRSAIDIQAGEELAALGVTVLTTTEDGSYGCKGLVTQELENLLNQGHPEGLELFCCGPDPMMRAVATIARRENLACQLSMEALMGCGFGVCLGCVVKDKNDNYIRVCKEGPVISAADLQDSEA